MPSVDERNSNLECIYPRDERNETGGEGGEGRKRAITTISAGLAMGFHSVSGIEASELCSCLIDAMVSPQQVESTRTSVAKTARDRRERQSREKWIDRSTSLRLISDEGRPVRFFHGAIGTVRICSDELPGSRDSSYTVVGARQTARSNGRRCSSCLVTLNEPRLRAFAYARTVHIRQTKAET